MGESKKDALPNAFKIPVNGYPKGRNYIMIMSTRRKFRCGFTLIELLVVIAIIALLMSILVPALRRARVQVRKVVCSSNLRQWGMAYNGYAADNEGFFPYNSRRIPA